MMEVEFDNGKVKLKDVPIGKVVYYEREWNMRIRPPDSNDGWLTSLSSSNTGEVDGDIEVDGYASIKKLILTK
jgi:hypothetical protein